MIMSSSHTRQQDMITIRRHVPPQVMDTLRHHDLARDGVMSIRHTHPRNMIIFSRHTRPQDMDTLRSHDQAQGGGTFSLQDQVQDGDMLNLHVQPQGSHTLIRHSHHRPRLDLMLHQRGVVLAKFHLYHRQFQRFQHPLPTRRLHRTPTRSNPPIRESRRLIGL
jgi:hypothetical protein